MLNALATAEPLDSGANTEKSPCLGDGVYEAGEGQENELSFNIFCGPGKPTGISCNRPHPVLRTSQKQPREESQWPAQGRAFGLGDRRVGPAPPLQLVTVRLVWQAPDLLRASVFTSENEVNNGRCLVNIDSDHSELVTLPSDDPDKSVTFGELEGTSEDFLGHWFSSSLP